MDGLGKKLRKPKIQNINPFILKKNKEIKDRKIKDIWKLFETEKENQERKKLEKQRT